MVRKLLNYFMLMLTIASLFLAGASAQSDQSALAVENACTAQERWNLDSVIERKWGDEIRAFVSAAASPVRGFAEAVAMRRLAQGFGDTPAEIAFSEYWISRALYSAKLYHQAHQGFSMVALKTPSPEIAPVQKAAILCLSQIHQSYAALGFPSGLPLHVLGSDQASQDALLYVFVQSASPQALVLLKGRHLNYASALKFMHAGKSLEAVKEFEAFLSGEGPKGALARFANPARVMLARSLYTAGKYKEAVLVYQAVRKASNELAHTLQELTWAHLRAMQYEETIGIGMHTRIGGLKNTFTPEAIMVTAMAYNEICQFPFALATVAAFRKQYAPSYQWLSNWSKKAEGSLYVLALKYLKNEPSEVPAKVASEWIRSPLFLSRQEEINLIFKEPGFAENMRKLAVAEQIKMRTNLLNQLRNFMTEYQKAKILLKPGETIPSSLNAKFEDAKRSISHYRRFTSSAPVWGRMMAAAKPKTDLIRTRLVKEIDNTFAGLNKYMLSQLDDIAENTQLIEVEIYSGASQDMIWKNAHPDYDDVMNKLGKEDDGRANNAEYWNWGRVTASEIDDEEIWEDELGASKADLTDNCSNKDKYIKVKRMRR